MLILEWRNKGAIALWAAGVLMLGTNAGAIVNPGDNPAIYTLDAEFEQGSLINLNYDIPDQLQLNAQGEPFDFIWIAVSSKGTVVKIDTLTGAVLGEYYTHPSLRGSSANPSRTTVDNDGSVWVANRNSLPGSVTHIGLEENGQCEDRDGDGVIDTSTGLGVVLPWSANPVGGAPDSPQDRNVEFADDECIVHHVPLGNNPSGGTRHLSVDANNDVWVGNTGDRTFDLIKGGRYDVPGSGDIIRSEPSVGYGGYGGLIDGNGVIWSARPLLQWDTANGLSGLNGDPAGASIGPPILGRLWAGQGHPDSYGLCMNPNNGEVWNTQVSGNLINRYAPDGNHLGAYMHGSENAQGCVVDSLGHIWVAHSLVAGGATTVGHLAADGTWLGNVAVGVGPTGVAVDGAGKIWATNYYSRTASRIDPSLAGGVGAVDFTTVDLGGQLYNYSDMTGSTLTAAPDSGTWTVTYDSYALGTEWGKVRWNDEPAGATPGNSSLTVEVRSSPDGLIWSAFETAVYDVDLTVPDGQFLEVRVTFARADTGESPVLSDLTIIVNSPPECDDAAASPDELWPPNHRFVDIAIVGVTDPDGDPINIEVTGITQDERLDELGDGSFVPDGQGVGTDTASVRAERSGTKSTPGNGRVYEIAFTATDDFGDSCTGTVDVCVPHDQRPGHVCIDDGTIYDSTGAQP